MPAPVSASPPSCRSPPSTLGRSDSRPTSVEAREPSSTYSPPAGAPGAGSARFTFTVHDGTDDSASAYTLTLDIAPAAPAPVPALPLLGHLLLALGLAGAGVRVLHRRQRSW